MTVSELLAQLNDLPVSALDKPVFISMDCEDLEVLPMHNMLLEDEPIMGYIITRKESQQLELDFTKDVN